MGAIKNLPLSFHYNNFGKFGPHTHTEELLIYQLSLLSHLSKLSQKDCVGVFCDLQCMGENYSVL